MENYFKKTHELLLKFLGVALSVNAIYLLCFYILSNYTKIIGSISRTIIWGSIALGIVSTFIWSKYESRTNSIKIHYSLQTVVRYFLAFIFVMYSFAKFYRTQLGPPYYHWLDTPLGDLTGFELTWAFFGTSYTYASFIGLSQLACAILLMFRRTQLLGACLLFPIISNIVVVNFEYDIPVKLPSVFFLIMTGYLIFAELPRLKKLFWDNAAVKKRDDPAFSSKQASFLYGVKYIFLIAFLGYNFWYFESMTLSYPSTDQPIAGVWKVNAYEVNGSEKPILGENVWTTIIFENQYGGDIAIIKTHEGKFRTTYKVDTARHSVSFSIHNQKFTGRYELKSASVMNITGQLGQDSLYISTKKKIY